MNRLIRRSLIVCLLAVPAAASAQDAPAAPEAAPATAPAAPEEAPAADSAAPSTAAPATGFVRQMSDDVLGIVNEAASGGATPERQARLRDAIRGFLSYEILAERTLGAHWETRTPEQREEFVTLLRDLIETSYSRRLGRGSVEPNSYTLTYTGERERRGRVTVSATLTAQGETYLLDVKMMTGDQGQWLVYDVITDDVSLEESYYESFANIIAEDGWEGLLQRMRDRLAELREG